MRCAWTALCLALGSCAAAGARDAGPGLPSRSSSGSQREVLALTLENDAPLATDADYTSGLGLSWFSRERADYPPESLRRRWIELGTLLPFVGGGDYSSFASLTLGHEMFTPSDIEDPAPPPADRPYAGLIYLEAGFYALRPGLSHTWALRAGLVGPSSLGGDVQRTLHSTLGGDEPRGWDHQLPDEPFVNLDYELAYELLAGGGPGSSTWRVVPAGTAGVGTYFTGVGASLWGQAGWNLPELGGHVSVRRGLAPFAAFGTGAREPGSISLHAGAGAYGVAHYLPLDGTVFRASVSVDSEPLVGFLAGGLVAREGRWSLALLVTAFGDTFRGQESAEHFGTMTLSWSL